MTHPNTDQGVTAEVTQENSHTAYLAGRSEGRREAFAEIASLKQRLESAEEVLRNIADRKGVCSTCGTMAVGGGSGYTDCDCRRPTWSENDPAIYASAFLQEQEKQNG